MILPHPAVLRRSLFHRDIIEDAFFRSIYVAFALHLYWCYFFFIITCIDAFHKPTKQTGLSGVGIYYLAPERGQGGSFMRSTDLMLHTHLHSAVYRRAEGVRQCHIL